jgi:hypothetical protein
MVFYIYIKDYYSEMSCPLAQDPLLSQVFIHCVFVYVMAGTFSTASCLSVTGQKICLHNELQRSLKYNVYMIIFLDHYLYKLIQLEMAFH